MKSPAPRHGARWHSDGQQLGLAGYRVYHGHASIGLTVSKPTQELLVPRAPRPTRLRNTLFIATVAAALIVGFWLVR